MEELQNSILEEVEGVLTTCWVSSRTISKLLLMDDGFWRRLLTRRKNYSQSRALAYNLFLVSTNQFHFF
jgi:hypothetical protein